LFWQIFGKADPYFAISRKLPDQSFQRIYRSDTIMNKLNVEWEVAYIPKQLMNNGASDDTAVIRIEIYDYDKRKADDFIGQAQCTVSDVLVPPNTQSKQLDLQGAKNASLQILAWHTK